MLRQAQHERIPFTISLRFSAHPEVQIRAVRGSVGPMSPLLTKEGEGGGRVAATLSNLPWPLLGKEGNPSAHCSWPQPVGSWAACRRVLRLFFNSLISHLPVFLVAPPGERRKPVRRAGWSGRGSCRCGINYRSSGAVARYRGVGAVRTQVQTGYRPGGARPRASSTACPLSTISLSP